MVEASSQFVIAPIKGEKRFQDFCLDLIRLEWNDDLALIHGRQGQGQDGVDITGTDHASGRGRSGMQCKASESDTPRALSVTDLDVEVQKAKKLTPPINHLIVAYTGPRNQKLQNRAATITLDHEPLNLFRVTVWAWEDIYTRAEKYPILQQKLREMVWGRPESAPTLTPARPTTANPFDAIRDQVLSLDSILTQYEENAKGDVSDAAGNATIDVLRDFIRNGNSDMALPGLLAFIANFDDHTRPRIKFRAYANLGAAYVGVMNFAEAAKACDLAADFERDTADGWSYRARAAQLRGDQALCFEAASRAAALDPDNQLAISLLIDSAADQVSAVDLEAIAGTHVTNGDIGWALSRRYSAEDDWKNAVRCARSIDDPVRWTRNVAIGDAVLHVFSEDLLTRIGVPLDDERQALLNEGLAGYEAAWEQIKKRRDHTLWVHVAMNLNATLRLVGRVDEADELAITFQKAVPDNPIAQTRAAMAYLHRCQFTEAMELAEAVGKNGDDEEIFFATHIFAAAKNYPEALKWGEKALETLSGQNKVRAAEVYLLALEQVSGAAEALRKALALEPELDVAPSFVARLAELARRNGDEATLERMRVALNGFDITSLDPIARFELSDAFADDEQWDAAAASLDGLFSLRKDSELLRRYLFALYRADRRAEARSFIESLAPEVRNSKRISNLGAAIYERSGLLDEATKLLGHTIRATPNDLGVRLDWARLNLRNNNEAAVQRWVKSAPLDLAGTPDDKMEFAQLLSKFGRRREALALADKVIRRHWGESETAHVRMTGLYFGWGRGKETWLFPKEVGENTEVTLTRPPGVTQTVRIQAADAPAADTFAPAHPFAKLLTGKRVGDTVSPPEGMGEPVEWTIHEIKHTYLALFHKALNDHATLFPGNSSIGMYSIDVNAPNAIEPILEKVRKRAELGQQVLDLYKDMGVPVDFVAKSLGVDSIDAAAGLRWKGDMVLETCVGTGPERENAFKAIGAATSVIADALTLSLWDEIGFLDIVAGLSGFTVEVVQATIDDLGKHAEHSKFEQGYSGGYLEAKGDKFQLTEFTKADRKARADKVINFAERVRAHTTIIPTEPWPAGRKVNEIDDILTGSSEHTITTAMVLEKVFICEDARMRALARELGVQRTAWTQPLLGTLAERGLITHTQYVKLLSKLKNQKIGFVSIGSTDLARADFDGDVEIFTVLAQALTLSTVEPGSLVNVLSTYIGSIWLRAESKATRERNVSILLNAVVTQRDKDWVLLLSLIYENVRDLFRNMSRFPAFPATSFHAYFVGFLEGHFIADKLVKKP